MNNFDCTVHIDELDYCYWFVCLLAFIVHNACIHIIGAIAVSIAGQEIFPVFNNLAALAPQKCEVDTCNQVRHFYFWNDTLMLFQILFNMSYISHSTILFNYFAN